MPISRITSRFEAANAQGRAAFVAYMMCGDPDVETSFKAMRALAENGADVIELGAPFTDPMADGPAIQKAAQRALASGTKLGDVLETARRFREIDQDTPVIIMGYANPIHKMGFEAFAIAAAKAGVDGIITVDLPPEEDELFRNHLKDNDIAVIRLATPTTTEARMQTVAAGASGFVYYVSVAGITGAGTGNEADIKAGVDRAKSASGLPIAVGFGVKTPEQAAAFSKLADGVVVGSAIVEEVRKAVEENKPESAPQRMGALVKLLADATFAGRS
jgi:tryptophan synthase alpha chain